MLITERLIIRPLEEKDIELIRLWRNKYKEYFFDSTEITQEMQRLWYQQYVESNNTDQMFIIELRETAVPIGQLAVYDISISNRTAKFGRFLIIKEYQRKGYAEEALKAIINYCFNVLGLRKLNLETYIDNTTALKVYYKAGFTTSKRPIIHLECVNKSFEPHKLLRLE